MDQQEHNIYSTRRPEHDGDYVTQRPRMLHKFWRKEIKRSRRRTLAFTSLVLLSLCAIGFVALWSFNQHDIAKKKKKNTTQQKSIVRSTTPTDFTADMKSLFMTDDLKDIAPRDIPTSSDVPFSTTWIKQAAHHLVTAEDYAGDGLIEEALDSYVSALRIFPSMQGVHSKMGLLYLRKKDFEASVEAFERAAEEETLSEGIANNLGVAYMGLKQYDNAQRQFLTALDIKPKYAVAQLNLATLYARTGEDEKAARYYMRYLAQKPDDTTTAQAYALILIRLGQWEKAVELLQRISLATPAVPPVHFNLAVALCQTGRFGPAMRALRHATDLVDARHGLAWMSKKEFDPMRTEPEFQYLIEELAQTEE